jgi:hypothetical protein
MPQVYALFRHELRNEDGKLTTIQDSNKYLPMILFRQLLHKLDVIIGDEDFNHFIFAHDQGNGNIHIKSFIQHLFPREGIEDNNPLVPKNTNDLILEKEFTKQLVQVSGTSRDVSSLTGTSFLRMKPVKQEDKLQVKDIALNDSSTESSIRNNTFFESTIQLNYPPSRPISNPHSLVTPISRFGRKYITDSNSENSIIDEAYLNHTSNQENDIQSTSLASNKEDNTSIVKSIDYSAPKELKNRRPKSAPLKRLSKYVNYKCYQNVINHDKTQSINVDIQNADNFHQNTVNNRETNTIQGMMKEDIGLKKRCNIGMNIPIKIRPKSAPLFRNKSKPTQS